MLNVGLKEIVASIDLVRYPEDSEVLRELMHLVVDECRVTRSAMSADGRRLWDYAVSSVGHDAYNVTCSIRRALRECADVTGFAWKRQCINENDMIWVWLVVRPDAEQWAMVKACEDGIRHALRDNFAGIVVLPWTPSEHDVIVHRVP